MRHPFCYNITLDMSQPVLLPTRHDHGAVPHAHRHGHGEHSNHDHSHDHGPAPHSHDHGQPHGHSHAHAADWPAAPAERADPPRLSLMALSAGQRLLLVTPLVGLLWALTLWAMHNG